MSRLRLALADGDDVQAALAASGVVGLWSYDIPADRLVLSASLAQGLGHDPAHTASGLPLARFLDAVHGADRARVENVLHAAIVGGTPFDVAFRTAVGGRSLSLRGGIACDGTGRPLHGRGIALDLTHEDGLDRPAQQAANRMAEHAIALHGLAGRLHRPALARHIEGVMREIGRELARHLVGAPGERRH